jgi:hypothetical protein
LRTEDGKLFAFTLINGTCVAAERIPASTFPMID